MDDAATVDLARRLCGELPVLLSAGDADRFIGELAALIEQGEAGEPVGVEILRLLRTHPGVRRRANELVEPAASRAFFPPPGCIRVPLGPRYVCPHGDFEYFRRDVSQPVPVCPHDGADLVLEELT